MHCMNDEYICATMVDIIQIGFEVTLADFLNLSDLLSSIGGSASVRNLK